MLVHDSSHMGMVVWGFWQVEGAFKLGENTDRLEAGLCPGWQGLWVAGAGRNLWKVSKCQVQGHSSLEQQARLGLQAGISMPSWAETLHCMSLPLRRLVRSDLWTVIPKFHFYPASSNAICLFIPCAPLKIIQNCFKSRMV